MRYDEFTEALRFLPASLRDRVTALRGHLTNRRCDECQAISDTLYDALTAARYEEHRTVEQLLAGAEALSRQHAGAHDRDGSACVVRLREAGETSGRGQVRRWAHTRPPLVAATDASWKGRAGGFAYVVSDGRWGLRPRSTDRLDPTGPSRVLVNELRAVEFLFTAYDEVPGGLTVLVDSRPALTYLRRWQVGDTDFLPAGYRLRPRLRAPQPTLVRLAQLVAGAPDVTYRHVKAHAGHPLNEAADALASMARRRVTERFDVRPRAVSLVDAFLRDWHANGAPPHSPGSDRPMAA
jgi:hypothetical protein